MKKNNPFEIFYWPFLSIRVLATIISPHIKTETNGLDVGSGNIPEEFKMNFALSFYTEKEWETFFKSMKLKLYISVCFLII